MLCFVVYMDTLLLKMEWCGSLVLILFEHFFLFYELSFQGEKF